VIVDAAFHQRQDRLEFVRTMRAESPNDIVAVCCYSKDPNLRRLRLEHRNQARDPLEVEEITWEDAEECLRKYEIPNDDEPYPLVYIDTDKNRIELRNYQGIPDRIKWFLQHLKDQVESGWVNGEI